MSDRRKKRTLYRMQTDVDSDVSDRDDDDDDDNGGVEDDDPVRDSMDIEDSVVDDDFTNLYEPSAFYNKWRKNPNQKSLDVILNGEPIRLQQMGSQYTVHTGSNATSVIHLLGALECGALVSVNVTGFKPYFLVRLAELEKNHDLDIDKYYLDSRFSESNSLVHPRAAAVQKFLLVELKKHKKPKRFENVPWVHSVEIVQRTDAKGLHKMEDFCKITLLVPQLVTPMRSWFENKSIHPFGGITTYESNIPFTQRFMKDIALIPASWFKVAKYTQTRRPYTYCAIEVTCSVEDIVQLPLEGDNLKTAPVYITTFDIETPTKDRVFPSEDKHEVACISVVTCVYGDVLHQFPIVPRTTHKDAKSVAYFADDPNSSKPPSGAVAAGALHFTKNHQARRDTKNSFEVNGKLCDVIHAPKCATSHPPMTYGSAKPIHSHMLTIGSEEPIDGCTILKYKDERELLKGFRDLIIVLNPIFLQGFNHIAFDIPYVIERARYIRIHEYVGRLSVLRNRVCIAKETTSGNKQTGQFKGKTVDIPGRVQLDVMRVCMKEKKYESYSLNTISAKLLGLQKDDVPHDKMYVWFHSDDERQRSILLDRLKRNPKEADIVVREIPPKRHPIVLTTKTFRQLVEEREKSYGRDTLENKAVKVHVYCEKDSHLTIQNEQKLSIVDKMVQFARILRVDLADVYGKGLTYQIVSQILHDVKQNENINKHQYVLPVSLDRETRGLKGGFVAIPVVGFHETPVITLDFTSMYPSMMIAFNLCITTSLTREQTTTLRKDVDYCEFEIEYEDDNDNIIKESVFFATESYRPGILPVILKKLLAERRVAQSELKKWLGVDGVMASILNTIQLVLKIDANSIYGFTGAPTNPLCNRRISNLVTTLARYYIRFSADHVLKNYPGSKLIYGDTDSIMVMAAIDGVLISTVEDALRFGPKLAAEITAKIDKNPIDIKFEKVYCPYLLLAKKRYCGMKYESLGKKPELQIAGMVCTQRTMCKYARDIVEKCIRLIVVDKNPGGAVEHAKKEISRLLMGRVSMGELVVTKTVTKPVQEYTQKAVHIELIKRIQKRDPSYRVHTNERIPFVFVDQGKLKNLVVNKKTRKMESKSIGSSDKSEDPLYVIENGLQIDTGHYLEQLQKPLSRLFAPIFADNKDNLAPRNVDEEPHVCKKCNGHIAVADMHNCPICIAMEKARKAIFHGDHARHKVVTTPSTTSGILKYTKVISKCLACGVSLPNDAKGGVCTKCSPQWEELYRDIRGVHDNLTERASVCIRRCEQCQGESYKDITCHHIHCDNFYVSKELPKELRKYKEKLDVLEGDKKRLEEFTNHTEKTEELAW